MVTTMLVTAASLQATTTLSSARIPMLHTKQENSTQKTSMTGERARLVCKPLISCPYNRCGTSLIPCNDISP
ncbi:hypothetical protein Hanom_Chr16g01507461 [Helianthus anomalus]